MSSLKQIRAGIKTTLEANIAGLHVYKKLPSSADLLPCVMVMPGALGSQSRVADFDVAMGRGTDTYNFLLYLFVAAGDPDIGQEALDDYVTGAGSKSVRQAIFSNKTLGLSDCNAHVSGLFAYSFSYPIAGIEALGAALLLSVATSGTS